MYIKRAIESQLLLLIKHFPSVAILGSRQVGKTTLVKEISKQLDRESVYLDLENPADNAAFVHPLEFINSVKDKTLIIDEIQRKPELFPILRSAIDSDRINGRFILLGSASKDLLLLSNETLGGRIVYNELTPFFIEEISNSFDFRTHWFRGGYPVSLTQNDDFIRRQWLRSFLSAYVERDLRMMGLGSSTNDIQRLLAMLTNVHGSLLNYNSLANSMGLSLPTVKNIISYFEKSFIIRILQPYYTNIGKRLIKTPKIYFRDSGIINFLLGISNYEELLRNPMLGPLWEGYVIENLIAALGDKYQYYFYRTADGTESDLLIYEGITCKAIVDAKFSPNPRPTKSSSIAIQDLNPEHALFVVPETKMPYSISNKIFVVSLEQAVSLLKKK